MRGMLSEMTASELAGWEEFLALEPVGSDAADHRAGVVAATIANALANRGGRPAFTPADFFPSRVHAATRSSVSAVDQVKAVFGWRGK